MVGHQCVYGFPYSCSASFMFYCHFFPHSQFGFYDENETVIEMKNQEVCLFDMSFFIMVPLQ